MTLGDFLVVVYLVLVIVFVAGHWSEPGEVGIDSIEEPARPPFRRAA